MISLKYYGLEKHVLTKEMLPLYYKQIVNLITNQYYQKDPGCIGWTLEELQGYFEEEYSEIFNKEEGIISTFIYLNEKNEIVGTFMYRDMFIYNEQKKRSLEKMAPDYKDRDYIEKIQSNCQNFIDLYGIQPKQCLLGTNLAFSADLMQKFKEKPLQFIFTVFLDGLEWAVKNGIKMGFWTQFRPSLITSTERLFKILENKNFEFRAGDGLSTIKGRLFLVKFDWESIEIAKKKLEI